MEIQFDLIPDDLKKDPSWVCWTVEERNGRKTKIPVNPKTGAFAKSNDPATWGTYEEAIKLYRECQNEWLHGIGFCLSNGYSGADLDHCYDTTTGNILPWAKDVIEGLKSYAEVTPSGEGLRVLITGKLPPGGRVKKGLPSIDGGNRGEIALYDSVRFFTLTGQHLAGTPLTIEQRESELAAIHANVFGSNGKPTEQKDQPSPCNLSDADIIEKARAAKNGSKFNALWSGKVSGYPSPSEADLALCLMLAFWAGNDTATIDRVFKQSGLYRPKWDRHGYNLRTIQKAISLNTKVYSPKPEQIISPIGEKHEIPNLLAVPLTDAGNAEAFKTLYGDQCLFVREEGKWLAYDGIKWADDDQVILEMLETVRRRGRQAMTELADLESRKSAVKWSLSSESKMKLAASLSIAESMLFQKINSFDRDPLLLCCANGVVDLRTGDLRGSKKDDYLRKSTNVVYDLEARCDRFIQFLNEIFDGNGDLIDFIQKAVGYSLTGLTSEQVIFILFGTGANGKSVFLNLLEFLFADYGLTTPASTFKDTPYDGIPNDVARMAQVRLVKSVEVKEGTRLNEERIKALTGGDRVTARFLHHEFFDFTPICKFWLAVNHKPVIVGTDEAIWRRIRLIPFEVFFPEKSRDPILLEKLKTELPGILRWAVEGCLRWQAEGLSPVGKVKDATSAYREESDLIGQFLGERTIRDVGAKTLFSEIYAAYETWCQSNAEVPIKGKTFGKRLIEKGFERKKTDQVRYCGLRLC